MDKIEKTFKVWGEMLQDSATQQRTGQALFNAIYEVIPELADKLRGSDKDPFYNDKLIPVALAELVSWKPE